MDGVHNFIAFVFWQINLIFREDKLKAWGVETE